MRTPAAAAWAVTSVAADLGRPAYHISLGGLLTACIIILTAAGAYAPTARIAILSLTSLCVYIAILETGLRSAIVIYIASGLITAAWPGLSLSWPFLFFFGPYPLVRHILDIFSRSLPVKIILRLVFANLAAVAAVFMFMRPQLIFLQERMESRFWFLPLLLQIVLVLYDMGLSLLIRLYRQRFRRH